MDELVAIERDLFVLQIFNQVLTCALFCGVYFTYILLAYFMLQLIELTSNLVDI